MEFRDVLIPDYGVLKVSEYGDIYGIKDYSKLRTPTEDKDGYLRIACKYRQKHIDENGIERKYTNQFVHRLVARAFIPNPDNLPVVNHKDGNKKNNHYTNLEWCTVQYNTIHAIENNLYKGFRGENNPKNKLSKEDIINIRKEYDNSEEKGYKFYDKYSKIYNVCSDNIRQICKRITWKNI